MKSSTVVYYLAIGNLQGLFIIHYLGIYVKQFVVTDQILLDNITNEITSIGCIEFSFIFISDYHRNLSPRVKLHNLNHTRRDMQSPVGIYCVMNRNIRPQHIMSNILRLILPSGFFDGKSSLILRHYGPYQIINKVCCHTF